MPVQAAEKGPFKSPGNFLRGDLAAGKLHVAVHHVAGESYTAFVISVESHVFADVEGVKLAGPCNFLYRDKVKGFIYLRNRAGLSRFGTPGSSGNFKIRLISFFVNECGATP